MKTMKPVFNTEIENTHLDTTTLLKNIRNYVTRGSRYQNERSTLSDTIHNSAPFCYVTYEGNTAFYNHIIRTGVTCPHCSSKNKQVFKDSTKHVILQSEAIGRGRETTGCMYILTQCEKCGKLYLTTIDADIEHSNRSYSKPIMSTYKLLNPFYMAKKYRGFTLYPTRQVNDYRGHVIFCSLATPHTKHELSKNHCDEPLILSEIFGGVVQLAVLSLSILSDLVGKYMPVLETNETFSKYVTQSLLDNVVSYSEQFNTIKDYNDVMNSFDKDYDILSTLSSMRAILSDVKTLGNDEDDMLLQFALGRSALPQTMFLIHCLNIEYALACKENETSLYSIM